MYMNGVDGYHGIQSHHEGVVMGLIHLTLKVKKKKWIQTLEFMAINED